MARKFIMSYSDSLVKRISSKDAKICVVGLGQVGLPTALTFCESGFDVIGHDINKDLLEKLNSGISPFKESSLEGLLETNVKTNRFHTENHIVKAVENSDIIIVCVPTPITEDARPDLTSLSSVCDSLSQISLKGKMVIIESSIPPGTFERLVFTALNKKNHVGTDCWAVFVPERLAPGQAITEIRTTPRVIGCIDEDSGLIAKSLYEKIVDSEILVTSIKVAEISKLVENTFRDVNVALANEVGLICEKYGIDVKELLNICNSHPRVNLLHPGPGVGGPCLPKDPYLLLNPEGSDPIQSKIILEARKINDYMPIHVIDLISNAIKEQNKRLEEATITVLGVAYKANVSDTRFSPSKEIITNLVKKGCSVFVHDPLTKENFGGQTVSDLWNAVSQSDILVIVTDHDEFKKFDLEKIQKTMKVPTIIDTRRIFDRKEAENLGIKYLAIGYTKKPKHK
ncbi:MAG: UDP-N-acetyl-D-mannosamine dehydrogenase [Nitrosopumilales archaeon]|nr:MAG: UDP-N-acetyl-D-mannosamine dehydrogenase [Nitrosopumilales archaeon]